MIEFKQWDAYWNNFNNWDEALLSDSNRPRDEFWFRIKPWMQSDKWDYRSSLKNILNQSIVKGVKWVTWTEDWEVVNALFATFKDEWLLSDIPWLDWFKYWTNKAYATYQDVPKSDPANHIESIPVFLNARKSEYYWDKNVYIKDWMWFVWKWASYILQYWADFIYPYWTSWHDTTQIKKAWVQLWWYNEKQWWWCIMRSVMRTCSSPDTVYWLYVWYLEANTYLALLPYHTWWTWSWDNWQWTTVLCTPTINAVQIS